MSSSVLAWIKAAGAGAVVMIIGSLAVLAAPDGPVAGNAVMIVRWCGVYPAAWAGVGAWYAWLNRAAARTVAAAALGGASAALAVGLIGAVSDTAVLLAANLWNASAAGVSAGAAASNTPLLPVAAAGCGCFSFLALFGALLGGGAAALVAALSRRAPPAG